MKRDCVEHFAATRTGCLIPRSQANSGTLKRVCSEQCLANWKTTENGLTAPVVESYQREVTREIHCRAMLDADYLKTAAAVSFGWYLAGAAVFAKASKGALEMVQKNCQIGREKRS